jgi:hypothetical protein
LHEAVLETFQPDGWHVFTRLFHEAAGLKPKPGGALILALDADGQADAPLPPWPPTPYEIEKGLHRALSEMPPQVAAFLLHVPRDPPAWRYQESEGERAERQALENLGAWTG